MTLAATRGIGAVTLFALRGLTRRPPFAARALGAQLIQIGWLSLPVVGLTALFAGAALAPGSDARLGVAVLVAMLLSSYLGTAAKAAGGRRQYGGVMARPTGCSC